MHVDCPLEVSWIVARSIPKDNSNPCLALEHPDSVHSPTIDIKWRTFRWPQFQNDII